MFHGAEAIPVKMAYTTPFVVACHADPGSNYTTVGKVDGVENATWAKVMIEGPLGEMNPLATREDGSPPLPNVKHVCELETSNTETKDPPENEDMLDPLYICTNTHPWESGNESLSSAKSTT